MVRLERPIIGITMGDPAGIGPEIAVKTLSKKEVYEISKPIVIGDYGVMKHASESITKLYLPIKPVESVKDANFKHGEINVLDLKNVNLEKLVHGKVDAMCGKASFEYIRKVIELALNKEVDATVTGPIHKEAINKAGYHYAGHTEIYAKLTKTKSYAMMLAEGDFRVAHVSTHVSLRKACSRVKKRRVLEVIKLADDAVKSLGIKNPKIGVAGLNPHSGEGGLFGNEEIKGIMPAVEGAKKLGINVEGPIPPDTIFPKAKSGLYDIVVAMYHDQGHIPLKMAGFVWDEGRGQWANVSGVNVTLGLPIIRTSVDHGVAFGKAGKGKASPDSLIEAVKTAVQMSYSKR